MSYQSSDWTFLQTPQFIISTEHDAELSTHLELTVRQGIITGGFLRAPSKGDRAPASLELNKKLEGQKLHEVDTWASSLSPDLSILDASEQAGLFDWLHTMLPNPT